MTFPAFGKDLERLNGNGRGNSRLEIELGPSSLFKEAEVMASTGFPREISNADQTRSPDEQHHNTGCFQTCESISAINQDHRNALLLSWTKGDCILSTKSQRS